MTGGIYFDIPRTFTCIGIEYHTEHNKVHMTVWVAFFFINIRIIFFKLYFPSFGNRVHVYRIPFNIPLVIKFI